jgi:two-component system, chemotaxis family, protein-glutamate methylesterase/glutaminase
MPQAVSAPVHKPDTAIRVMIVDDSVVFRGLVARWVGDETDMAVVATHRNGFEAVENLTRANPDIVVLDIEMPVLDGLATLPLLFAKKPEIVVLIASTLTRRNAEVGMKALTLGAADYLQKPESNREASTSPAFRRDIIAKIRQLGRRSPKSAARIAPKPVVPVAEVAEPQISLRPFSQHKPRALLVGSSTGGPQALQTLMRGLAPVLHLVPVMITQHMPPTFTTILAEHIARASGRPAHEAANGERIVPGTIYVAPGGKHLLVERRGDHLEAVLDDSAPVHFCKPAVDPMFASAANVFGNGTLALILTGMGVDGSEGAAQIAAAGGSVIAQDEATSVVWGMPGTAAEAGVCSAVLPVGEIAPQVIKLVNGGSV